jgi:hypothetical protein
MHKRMKQEPQEVFGFAAVCEREYELGCLAESTLPISIVGMGDEIFTRRPICDRCCDSGSVGGENKEAVIRQIDFQKA